MYVPLVYLVLATVSLCRDGDTARVLGLFPHTGKSHQMVFDPLLRALAERGHHVTVVSFFPIKDPPANYTDISLEGIAPPGVETFDINFLEGIYDPLSVPRILGLDRILSQILGFHPLAEMAVDVCRKLVELPALRDAMRKEYDVVLVENFSSDCMLGLAHVHGLEAPKVALLSSNMMPWSPARIGVADNPSYVPLVSTEFTDRMSFPERLENTFMNYFLKFWFQHVQTREQELIERQFGRRVDLEALGRNMSLMMVNTFHALNGVRPLVPGLIEVGGMHLDHRRKPIPEYMERFLNESEEGVILFSWGSLIRTATLPPHKEEQLVRALSRLPQRVIWKYEDSPPGGNLTGNILRVNWIPQYELLQHKKVIAFIAHGGLLGMTEAVSAGKPMLVVPFFGDQPSNGAAATAAGLATVVRYADLNERTFTEGLNKVLSAQMRLSARKASAMWRDRPTEPLATAVYWTERVARWGSAAVLHSSLRDTPTYQLALLDVLAAFILAIIVLILLLKFTLKLIVHALWAMVVKEPKKKMH